MNMPNQIASPNLGELPRVLVLDLTPIGHNSATGQIKATLFQRWQSNSIACVTPHGRMLSFTTGNEESMHTSTRDTDLLPVIEAFAPCLIYIRPVPQAIHLVPLALILRQMLGIPIITHIMDDDLSHLKTTGAHGEYGRYRMLVNEIWCAASARLAISESLGQFFVHTFGGDYQVVSNCIAPSHWLPREEVEEHTGSFVIRYSGAFSDRKESSSLLKLAEAVESFGGQARFEVSVMRNFRENADSYLGDFQHTRVIDSNPDKFKYRKFLKEADILVAAYNFDPISVEYLRYSFGNKLPEIFATGKPVLVYGPDSILSVRYAQTVPGVHVVSAPDKDAIRAKFMSIFSNYADCLSRADDTREFAFEKFSMDKTLLQFEKICIQTGNTPQLRPVINTKIEKPAHSKYETPVGYTMKHSITIKDKLPLFVLGNGPSLRGFDFKQFGDAHTIGMNAAYRFWDEIGWYPTYYACLDTVLGLSHQVEIERLVQKASGYGMRGFLLRNNLIEKSVVLSNSDLVFNYDQIRENSQLMGGRHITTGSHACRFGVYLGYSRIYLLGIDCNYVERVTGSDAVEAREEEHSNCALGMIETPNFNPNYFFNTYQQKGDRYNVPNSNPDMPTHLNSFRETEIDLAHSGAVILNANLLSKVDAFDFIRPEDALHGSINPIPRSYIVGQIPAWPPHLRHGSTATYISGPYDRKMHASFDEIGFVRDTFFNKQSKGIMLDVGAHYGSSAVPFAEHGWKVIAFEPDPDNREKLVVQAKRHKGITIDKRAVSRVPDKRLTLYSSKESSGVSSLTPFLASHRARVPIKTTSITEAIEHYELPRVDFLKIDVEGFEMDVLQGVPWEKLRPHVILAEFEDGKTLARGYSTKDLIDYLRRRGYVVLVSEWHPVIKYGTKHDWNRLYVAPCDHPSQEAWGNLIAVHQGQQFHELKTAADRHIKTKQEQ